MRVGIAISRYKRSGGLERVSGEWARGLVSRGHEVTVFTQLVERSPGDEAIRFTDVGGLHSPIAARAATFPPAVTRAVKRAALDGVISFGCTVLAPCVVRLPGAHRPWWELANSMAPVSSYEGLRRRMNPHHRFVLEYERLVLRSPDSRLVLAASDRAAGDIKRLYPRAASRVRVVPDGIDLAAFDFDFVRRDAQRSEWGVGERFVLLTVATEVRRKGIAELMRAFARTRGAVLVVVGKAARDEVIRLAAEHGVSDRVRAVGFVKDIVAAYCAADLLVFPTIFDPWGLPVVESLACGTPVVASIQAGSAQVISGSNGVLIGPANDAPAINAAIEEAMAKNWDRAAARSSVEHLAWPGVIDKVEEAFREAFP